MHYLALTLSTLLSSQGSGATLALAITAAWGNSIKLTPITGASQSGVVTIHILFGQQTFGSVGDDRIRKTLLTSIFIETTPMLTVVG